MSRESETGSSAQALNAAAGEALRGGRLEQATDLLQQAAAQDPSNPVIRLNLAGCYRAQGQTALAMEQVNQVLAAAPRSFVALLMKGGLLETQGRRSDAASSYGAALSVAPPNEQLDQATRQALGRARAFHSQFVQELRTFINSELNIGPQASQAERQRVALFVDAHLGLRRIYRQEPTDYHYPGLPAIEFHERREFPWLESFEAATEDIIQEARAVLSDESGFVPYVDYQDSVPLDQWQALNRSANWSAFHFFHFGKRYEQNCARCPKTMAALAHLPQPVVTGRMPAAMFSVLRPHTRIPPHTGVANVRLVAHLPLIVPERCGFRVGNERREWKVGEAWVFDDTIEHEAWNDSDQLRVILICDLWNPRLGESERAAIAAIMAATDRFQGTVPSADI